MEFFVLLKKEKVSDFFTPKESVLITVKGKQETATEVYAEPRKEDEIRQLFKTMYNFKTFHRRKFIISSMLSRI